MVSEQILEFKNRVLEKMDKQVIEVCDLNKINYDFNECRFTYAEVPFSKEATDDFCDILQIQNTFPKKIKKATKNTEFWQRIKTLLVVVANRNQYQCKIIDGQVEGIWKNNKMSIENLQKNFETTLDKLIVGVHKQKKEYSLKSSEFDGFCAEIILLDENPVQVIEDDLWKSGLSVNLSLEDFSLSSFYERLVCLNGLRKNKDVFKIHVKNMRYKPELIQEKINIALSGEKNNEYLIQKVLKLKNLNASVSEYLSFRKNVNDFIGEAVNDFFEYDENNFQDFYGDFDLIGDKSTQKTADCGMLAYSLLNKVTEIASHKNVCNTLKDNQRKSLQIKAGDFLFKKKLDLELVAPKIKIKI